MGKIKFYSEYDMICGLEIEEIIKKIHENAIEIDWSVNDLIEFYNIAKYIQIKRFADYIVENTGSDIKMFEKKIRQKIGKFIGINKSNFIDLYKYLDYKDTEDFIEIIENYGIYKEFRDTDFKNILNNDYMSIYIILKFKKLTNYFDHIVKENILSNCKNIETIISKYLDQVHLYLPPSLSEKEILTMITEYINSSQVNINVLRKIILFPSGKGITIPDKVRLHAKRREKEEKEKIFNNGAGIESSILISYPKDQEEVIVGNIDGKNVDIKISRKWLEENHDFPTLWNNFIHIFDFIDDKGCLTFVSKISEMGAFESIIGPTGKHLYNTSFAFRVKQMTSDAEIYSYIKVLSVLGIRLEEMIEWFFHEYLKKEFSIKDFVVKMPSENTSYFEKCRTIIPEIDRIFKQFNVLIEDKQIDQELIQMSSSSVKSKDIISFNDKKYVYPMGEWYQRASFLLFSDQSGIFYIKGKYEEYKNLLELVITENILMNDFNQYQVQAIKWLIDNKLLIENEQGHIKVANINLVYVLKELYYGEVLSYWHYPNEIRKVIGNLANQNNVYFESSLLSRNEQDYFDYYLNKAKFTNGYDIRNKYMHGTNSNDEKQHETDYYLILKLLIIIVLKINDDLCIKDEHVNYIE